MGDPKEPEHDDPEPPEEYDPPPARDDGTTYWEGKDGRPGERVFYEPDRAPNDDQSDE